MKPAGTKESFIQAAQKVHGDRYLYDKVQYVTSKIKVCIICPEHGEFWQIPNSHLRGIGCPACGRLKANKSESYTQEDFIAKAQEVHGDRYDYRLVNYVNSQTKVKIICPEHGVFLQRPAQHIFRAGCPKCGRIAANTALSDTTANFIARAKKIHNNKYDYSGVDYVNNRVKVKIVCPKHGMFLQAPDKHLAGQGCPECKWETISLVKRNDWADVKAKFIQTHGNKYNYSKVDYVTSQIKVKIVCPEHGEFEQTPSNHINGQGCPECGKIAVRMKLMDSLEGFIEKSRQVHGDKYDYSLVEYKGNKVPVKIICPQHGVFEQIPNSHTMGCGCSQCTHHISKGEQEIMDWIREYVPNAEHAYRKLDGYEIDIYLPDQKIGIEYNGVYYHSTEFREKYAHRRKLEIAQKMGIRLMQFWDLEWETKQDIVKSIILNALGIHSVRIFARDTVLCDVSSKNARAFCEENHLHGFRAANKYLGLYYNRTLVALMSYKLDGEMVRFVIKKNYSVVGAFSKLLKHSDVTYSFVDRRVFTGDGYLQHGFTLSRVTLPNYFYVHRGKYAGSRQMFQKHKLKDILPVYDASLTETQNMEANDYYAVYDCGHLLMTRSK